MPISHPEKGSERKENFGRDAQKPSHKKRLPYLLQSFGHQVSGRATMLCYNFSTICKPHVSRELFFYHYLPPQLKEFTPQFRGVINVTFIENGLTGAVLTYAQPKTLLHPESRDISRLIEHPKPHSKRCVRDFGKTHVIYPSDPRLKQLRDKMEGFVDEVDSLAHGLDTNVSFRSDDVDHPFTDERSGESSGLQNPWNSKVIDDAWAKVKFNYVVRSNNTNHTTTAKTKRFMLLENVTSPYKRPCVLDLKMGTRVRQNASTAKLSRHVTAIDMGARLSGMQIYHPKRKEFDYINKYCGHNLGVVRFKAKLLEFFSRGHILAPRCQQNVQDIEIQSINDKRIEEKISYEKVDCNLVTNAVAKLTRLRNAVASLESHRFYSCSILLIYEGETVLDKLPHSPVTTSLFQSQVVGNSGDKSSPLTQPLKLRKPLSSNSKLHPHRPKSLPPRNSSYFNKSEDSSPEVHPNKETFLGVGDGPTAPTRAKSSPIKIDKKKSFAHSPQAIFPKMDMVKKASKRRRRTKSCGALRSAEPEKVDKKIPTFSVGNTADLSNSVDVRLIDFAHFCFQDATAHPGPDGGFLFGLDNLISLLKSMLTE